MQFSKKRSGRTPLDMVPGPGGHCGAPVSDPARFLTVSLPAELETGARRQCQDALDSLTTFPFECLRSLSLGAAWVPNRLCAGRLARNAGVLTRFIAVSSGEG